MVRDGACCGDMPACARVCSGGFLGRVWFLPSVFLSCWHPAREQDRAPWQVTKTECVAGRSRRPDIPVRIHLSMKGRLCRRSESKCLASLQGQMFFSAMCHDRRASRIHQTSAVEPPSSCVPPHPATPSGTRNGALCVCFPTSPCPPLAFLSNFSRAPPQHSLSPCSPVSQLAALRSGMM